VSDASSILVVDDDETFRARLVRAFADRGLVAKGAASRDEAVAAARAESPELAVVDLRMPGGSGLEVLRALKEIDATTKVVLLTGYGSIANTVEAMKLGATNYLQKPADADEILAAFSPNGGAARASTPSLARVEWEHMQRVLADAGGSVSEAARRLGMHRRSLQRKLSKHPVSE
jgi:two-component system response regulator RegA